MLNPSASIAMSTCVLKALPGKHDRKVSKGTKIRNRYNHVPHSHSLLNVFNRKKHLQIVRIMLILKRDYLTNCYRLIVIKETLKIFSFEVVENNSNNLAELVHWLLLSKHRSKSLHLL